jgi:hypothetical protein
MSEPVLRALDLAFFIFHGLVIVVNLTGWLWRPLRRGHLLMLGLTGFSWFGLGPLLGYPLGYCICTDAHWRIRQQLGIVDRGGYIELLFRMAGLPISAETAAAMAYSAFGLAVLATIAVNTAGWLRRRRAA